MVNDLSIGLTWPNYRPYAYVLGALWFVAVALGVMLVLVAGVTGAVAADDPGNETAADENGEVNGNETDVNDDDVNGNETIESDERISIDSNLDLVEWEYDASTERFIVTFESERTGGSRISMSEHTDNDRGVTRYNVQQERISGTETVEFPARMWQGEAGMSVVSDDSLEETGTGISIETGERSGDDPFDTPGRMAWFGGAGVALVAGIVAFRRRLFGGSGKPKSAWGEW